MGSWRAKTDQKQFDSGTLLSIYWQPWGDGIPVPSLVPGASIFVHFTSGTTESLIVIEVVASETSEAIIVQTTDRTKWRMIEPSLQQRAMAAGTGGAPTVYWIVEQRLI
jgi:hypothetical protein